MTRPLTEGAPHRPVNPCTLRPLGRSGIEVTTLGFGAAPLGGFRGAIDEAGAAAAIHAALDAGLNLFDTSPYYGYGRSELRVGAALRDLPRDRYVLSTKIGRVMEPLDEANPPTDLRQGGLRFQPRFDYSADGARRSIEQSMLRLGMPDIDVLLIHDVDVYTHGSAAAADARYAEVMAGCYPVLESLRDAGVIKAIGIGINEVERALRFVRDTDIDCILLAGRYTLLEQGAAPELLPACVERGIGVVVGGPFNSGVLATGPGPGALYDYHAAPPEVNARVARLHTVCAEHGVRPVAAALQFPLAHEAVASVIPGPMNAAQFTDNLRAMSEPIPPRFWQALKDAALIEA